MYGTDDTVYRNRRHRVFNWVNTQHWALSYSWAGVLFLLLFCVCERRTRILRCYATLHAQHYHQIKNTDTMISVSRSFIRWCEECADEKNVTPNCVHIFFIWDFVGAFFGSIQCDSYAIDCPIFAWNWCILNFFAECVILIRRFNYSILLSSPLQNDGETHSIK